MKTNFTNRLAASNESKETSEDFIAKLSLKNAKVVSILGTLHVITNSGLKASLSYPSLRLTKVEFIPSVGADLTKAARELPNPNQLNSLRELDSAQKKYEELARLARQSATACQELSDALDQIWD